MWSSYKLIYPTWIGQGTSCPKMKTIQLSASVQEKMMLWKKKEYGAARKVQDSHREGKKNGDLLYEVICRGEDFVMKDSPGQMG